MRFLAPLANLFLKVGIGPLSSAKLGAVFYDTLDNFSLTICFRLSCSVGSVGVTGLAGCCGSAAKLKLPVTTSSAEFLSFYFFSIEGD